ncbi:MAG TPA: type I methionyl aminopeptidase, partial [Firmicutes bacterium]|nr:type I methionyl aminopeptidase [Bacillota bacterium]
MVIIKSPQQIELMQAAAKVLVACHRELRKKVRPGVTTLQLDQFVEEFIKSHGATPEQKGYHGFPYSICASIDDEICHGFPSAVPLRKGS